VLRLRSTHSVAVSEYFFISSDHLAFSQVVVNVTRNAVMRATVRQPVIEMMHNDGRHSASGPSVPNETERRHFSITDSCSASSSSSMQQYEQLLQSWLYVFCSSAIVSVLIHHIVRKWRHRSTRFGCRHDRRHSACHAARRSSLRRRVF